MEEQLAHLKDAQKPLMPAPQVQKGPHIPPNLRPLAGQPGHNKMCPRLCLLVVPVLAETFREAAGHPQYQKLQQVGVESSSTGDRIERPKNI
mmetsp:Transcript_1364/g.3056  ORF Transcript_1364/g.3056 Transcript_1364/m.3056 type:complete len:92 (+) Transcript_1364:641-916(+)